jgi:hypothetical protein
MLSVCRLDYFDSKLSSEALTEPFPCTAGTPRHIQRVTSIEQDLGHLSIADRHNEI